MIKIKEEFKKLIPALTKEEEIQKLKKHLEFTLQAKDVLEAKLEVSLQNELTL